MTQDIYIILDYVINGVNYCCHPVCYRTVWSLKASVGLVGSRNCPVNEKGHRSLSQQQFMCASLQRRTFKSYSPQAARLIMHVDSLSEEYAKGGKKYTSLLDFT